MKPTVTNYISSKTYVVKHNLWERNGSLIIEIVLLLIFLLPQEMVARTLLQSTARIYSYHTGPRLRPMYIVFRFYCSSSCKYSFYLLIADVVLNRCKSSLMVLILASPIKVINASPPNTINCSKNIHNHHL